MLRTIFLLLLLLPAGAWAQDGPDLAPPPAVRHTGNTFSIGDTMRPEPRPSDTDRAAREIAALTSRLRLDSIQTAAVAGIVGQRQQLLRQLREAPISDRDVRRLRFLKIFDDADQAIKKVLDEKQRKAYDTIVAERLQQMKQREEPGPGPGRHRGHDGGRGPSGSGGSRQ
ncbi:MAG TPA: hypothetical protein VMF29_05325 [Candidatus Edwardsbacteria bacterium]|nr:hypothetical protein [Candidatus Edwardsbacteria bacterium]